MTRKKIYYTILLTGIAFILCLPMLLWDEYPARDVIDRYAPMAEAFGQADWAKAFHPRVPPLLPVTAGIFSWLFDLTGAMACKIVSALFFALTVIPLTALMSKIFNFRYALWSGAMYILCSRLMRIAGMGVRDTAKCFFLVLATYGLVCFFQKYNWKGVIYCSLGCVGLTLNRGDSLLFALLFLLVLGLIELCKQKVFPYKALIAVIVFIFMLTPWVGYEYKETGWPVTEIRHAILLNKIFKTEKSAFVAPKMSFAKAAPQIESPKKEEKRKSNRSFLKNLLKGFYPQYLIFIIPVLFFRIKRKIFSPEEIILLSVVLIHAIGMIAQIAVADKQLFIYKRYLIVATPLMFGWAAIGLRWLYENSKKYLPIKHRWLANFALVIMVFISVFDGLSRVRKNKLNPYLNKVLKKHTGIDISK
jgi:4-amino-4-deoxy-L-arabinose transferase-like glycosyltransferase